MPYDVVPDTRGELSAVKSAVETVDPTRVRLTVEVPFDELQQSLDAAYRRISAQVNVPGFRKGKVPPRLIDQRFGRATVLEEAVNEAIPRLYGQAVREHALRVLGQPEVDVTEFADGGPLTFTADVEVRPDFEVPDHTGVSVTVDDATVTEEQVEEQVEELRARFGTLVGVERAAQTGDFVQIDLTASVDGEEVDSTTGVSYEVGSDTMLDGLDEALIGLSAGDRATFTTTLAGGEHAGEEAAITVTVGAVKVRELPALDDDFAQLASEFDTLEELRADLRTRLERVRRLEQAVEARDKILEAYLGQVEFPLPERLLESEVTLRRESLQHQLAEAGLDFEDWLSAGGKSVEEFEADLRDSASAAIKAQFVLDALASAQQLSVSQEDLTEHIVSSAARAGVSPDQFAQHAVESEHVPTLVAEVVRGKAMALVVENATVTDTSGNPVDLKQTFGRAAPDQGAPVEDGSAGGDLPVAPGGVADIGSIVEAGAGAAGDTSAEPAGTV